MFVQNPLKENHMLFGLITPPVYKISYETARIFASPSTEVPPTVKEMCASTMALRTADVIMPTGLPHELACHQVVMGAPIALLVSIDGKAAYAVVIRGTDDRPFSKTLEARLLAEIGLSAHTHGDVQIKRIVADQ